MTRFIWDAHKEIENAIKHGVDFQTAAAAFLDPRRRIMVDSKHSGEEERFFLDSLQERFSQFALPTVAKTSESSAPESGEREKRFMKKRHTDPNMPVGKLVEVSDFLPPPEALAKARSTVIVTIGLEFETVRFFKQQAAKHGTKYQKMIREVLDRYVNHFRQAA